MTVRNDGSDFEEWTGRNWTIHLPFVFVLLYSAIFVGCSHSTVPEEKQSSQQARMLSEEIEVPENWETYRNKEFGLEFKYPSNYENESGCGPLVEQEEGSTVISITPLKLRIKEDENRDLEQYVADLIEEKKLENPPYYNRVTSRESLFIAGKPAEKINWSFMGANPSFPVDMVLQNDHTIYHLQYNKKRYSEGCPPYDRQPENEQEPEELTLQMISTLEFRN